MERGKYILKCEWLRDKPITHNSNKTSLKLLNEVLIAKVYNIPGPVPDKDWGEEETLQKRK